MVVVFAFHRSSQNEKVAPFNEIYLKQIVKFHKVLAINIRHVSLKRKMFYIEAFEGYSVVEFSGVIHPEKHENIFFRMFNRMAVRLLLFYLNRHNLITKVSLIHQIGFFHPVGLYFAKLCRLPLLIQIIGNDKYSIKKWKLNFSFKTKFTANSKELAESLPASLKPAKVIYRGVGPEIYRNFNPKGIFSYHNIFYGGGFPDYNDRPDFRKYNYKGGLSFLDAVSELNNFVIKVAGPNCDIGREYSKKKLIPNLKFLNFLSHQELLSELLDTDIIVVPSLDEGIANIAMEAMLAECLVISRAVGGMPEIITNRENGILFNTDDDLRTILLEINFESQQGRMQKYDAIRKNARKTMLKEFDNKFMINAYNEIYKSY